MILQLAFVLTAIIIGARLGGIGLGVMGGVGLAILTFVFSLQPTAPPIDVMLMIAAVISAASCMQAAGGLDYMVKLAEHLLRKNPSHVTLLSPLVTYLFTFVAGTGHVAYSVLPVIAEVATETKIRPERPLGIAVIASQQAITASPISAATVRALMPLGIALGISPYMLIALFPAVNGYFFIPNYPTVVAAINFDRTGTTKIGKYVLNHSFMMPGLVSTIVAIALGLLFIQTF